MRKTLLGIAGVSILLLVGATPGFSGGVNCGIVNKDLEMGRTPEDISERMMISVEDVKKCQAEAKEGKGAAAPAAAKKPAGKEGGATAGGEHADH
jgi:hypothetical protein